MPVMAGGHDGNAGAMGRRMVSAEDLRQMKQLLDEGIITEADYAAVKERFLAALAKNGSAAPATAAPAPTAPATTAPAPQRPAPAVVGAPVQVQAVPAEMPAPVAQDVPAAKPKRKIALIAAAVVACAALIAGGVALGARILGGNPGSSSEDSRGPVPRGLSVGDTFTFGTYEQDNDSSNGPEPVEWRVLAIEDGRMLVIAVAGLDHRPFNDNVDKGNDWETSDLKRWLENDFPAAAFTDKERSSIAEVTCLSVEEVRLYFPIEADRICMPTAFAKVQGVFDARDEDYYPQFYGCYWWLRSSGYGQDYAAYVYSSGYIDETGSLVDGAIHAVRPALWLSL